MWNVHAPVKSHGATWIGLKGFPLGQGAPDEWGASLLWSVLQREEVLGEAEHFAATHAGLERCRVDSLKVCSSSGA